MSHWRNSQFQYLAFVIGACHTADEAWRRAKMEHAERAQALAVNEGALKKAEARRMALAEQMREAPTAHERLDAEAELMIMEANAAEDEALFAQTIRDRDFLADVVARLEPHRKYRGLPEHEANQLIQREEWLYELLRRAENYMATGGSLPPNELNAMRMHPDFEAMIAPELGRMMEEVRRAGSITFRSPLLERLGIAPVGPVPELAPVPLHPALAAASAT